MAQQEGKMDMEATMEVYRKLGNPGRPSQAAGGPGGKLDHQDQGMDGTR